MTAEEILSNLRQLGSEGYKKIIMKHGVKEPVYGVKIEELKKIAKETGKDHGLALALFDSGVYDARYLAGLIADPSKMTKKDLQHWAKQANAPTLHEYTVPWVASESRFAWELGVDWIESRNEGIASTGWSTLGSLVAIKADADLNLPAIEKLLGRVKKTIHGARNRVRYTMNGFVISVGCYVIPLAAEAKRTAAALGSVEVDAGETSCRVPDAAACIAKIEKTRRAGKKRKTAAC